jgi:hypothetical protein
MSITTKMLAFAAVTALTAATAVPAMALENEFHGMYKMKYFVSNMDNGGGGFYAPTASEGSANNYFEQRARIIYAAKANENLKLVTAFEIDSVFGDRAQGNATRNSGAALDTDAVNIETKWVHLDFNIPSTTTNVKVGTQAIKDSIKGILFDMDAGGIFTASKFGNAMLNVGYFRGYEQIGTTAFAAGKRGVNNLDIAILEGKYNVSKDLAIGADYYGYFDYRQNNRTMMDHTLALSADAKAGPVTLSGFVAGQFGSIEDRTGATPTQDLTGFAANLAAKVAAGPGTIRAAALYTSGDNRNGANASKNHAWMSVQQDINGATPLTVSGQLNTYNESGMMLLNRNAAAEGTTSDLTIAATTNNKNQGLTGFFVGYDATITPKLLASANLGVALTSEKNSARPINKHTGGLNSDKLLGTEINAEIGYKVYDNLTASVQAAYVFLGDYYKGTATNSSPASSKDPMDPYTTRLVLSYVF